MRWLIAHFPAVKDYRCSQVLLVGDSGVGKSSLLMRFTADTFEDSSAPTIGAHCTCMI